MANDKKDLSLSDLDLSLDLDIERDKTSKQRIETSSIAKKPGNTLDYYNDEMSRSEVERLIKGHTGEVDIATMKEAAAKSEDGIDYAYILNLLNETKKTDGINKSDTEKIVTRKTKFTRAYRTTRLALITMIVVFLITSLFLVNSLVKSNNKLTTLEASMEELKSKADLYEELNVKYDGLKDKAQQLTAEKTNLENTILSLTHQQPTTSVGSSDTTTGNDTASTVQGPTKYVVQNGDSYWRISLKFYNNGSYYKDILAANNITDETQGPHPGQELIIPQK